ncbi:thioredoxin family protein [Thiomicrorhabdus cannonii]|uniref:thioredoxin family protein n=1 Tax=Thiomicrorhabdus cannonii TaxID=2748011 RepID=UPI0015BC2BB9|nr:thioredoxin family protein [Thiomicrorhabdus cannonii]
MTRLRHIWLVWMLFAGSALAAWPIPPAKDLSETAKVAKVQNIPVVLYFTRLRCPPCGRFEDNALTPLVQHGLLDGFVELVEVQADARESLVYFDGSAISPAELAELYNVTTFPRLVFVNAEGDALGIRMENSGAYDYFPYYFKQRINEALQALGNSKRVQDEF